MRTLLVATLIALMPIDAPCQPRTLGVPIAYAGASNGPVLGLADFHNHQFAYLGFGGTSINHTIHANEPCLPPLAFDKNSFYVRDVIRQSLFPESVSPVTARRYCLRYFSRKQRLHSIFLFRG